MKFNWIVEGRVLCVTHEDNFMIIKLNADGLVESATCSVPSKSVFYEVKYNPLADGFVFSVYPGGVIEAKGGFIIRKPRRRAYKGRYSGHRYQFITAVETARDSVELDIHVFGIMSSLATLVWDSTAESEFEKKLSNVASSGVGRQKRHTRNLEDYID